jgi:hypothetical protein
VLKKERKEIHSKGHERKKYMPKSMRKKKKVIIPCQKKE